MIIGAIWKKVALAVVLFIGWTQLMSLVEYYAGSYAVLGLLSALGCFAVGWQIMNFVDWVFERNNRNA